MDRLASDPTYLRNNLIPALIWCAICIPFLPWHFKAFFALMVFRCGIVGYCFLVRRPAQVQVDSFRVWVSRAAALLPLGLYYAPDGSGITQGGLVLIVLGTFLVCLSCIDLGKSFGVSPAVRPYVASGVYRYLPHPMYLGHFVTEAGILLISPTLRNALVIAASWSFYFLRMHWEDELFEKEPQPI